MNSLAISYSTVGRKADALALREESLRLFKAKYGPDDPVTLNNMDSLASWYTTLGRAEDGIVLRTETLERRRAVMGADHPDTLHCMNNLGWGNSVLGRHAEALVIHEQTLALRTAKLGPSHPDTLDTMAAVTRCLIRLERGADALSIIDDCIRRASGVGGRSGLVVEMVGYRLQHFFKARDVEGYRTSVAMWEGLGRTDAPSLYRSARVRAALARLIRERDKSAEAEQQSRIEADVAMDWLRKAFAAGYKDASHMAKNTDLDELRSRPDFITLMAEMSAAPKKVTK